MRRALKGGDLLAARTAAAELPHVGLEDAAALLVLIASREPERLEPAVVRFLGRVCLEQAPSLEDARLLAACLAQLEDESPGLRTVFSVVLKRVGLAGPSEPAQGEHMPQTCDPEARGAGVDQGLA